MPLSNTERKIFSVVYNEVRFWLGYKFKLLKIFAHIFHFVDW